MNNQTLLLLAIGGFVALIVTVVAVDQWLLDEHPPTEVEGLLWRVENAFNHIQDLEATLQLTNERWPTEIVRMKIRYVKGPPAALSARYVLPQEADGNMFVSMVRDETFTIQSDQLSHYIPSEDIVVSKRWPGLPLAAVGLGVFDVNELREDWAAGRTEIRILQDISGFTGLSIASSVSLLESFSETPLVRSDTFSLQADPLSTVHDFSFCPTVDEDLYASNLGLGQILDAQGASSGPIAGSYILEIRDATSQDLLRMIWVDRETFLIQKVVTFTDGQRSATLLVQLMTIDQGLTEADIIAPPQSGVVNIRG